ncbi:hypothetical protein FKM82_029283 [Ascaphus truei]
MDDRLHCGMVGGTQSLPQGEEAVALAVEGVIALGGDDPSCPPYLLKVHVKGVALAWEDTVHVDLTDPSTLGHVYDQWKLVGGRQEKRRGLKQREE